MNERDLRKLILCTKCGRILSVESDVREIHPAEDVTEYVTLWKCACGNRITKSKDEKRWKWLSQREEALTFQIFCACGTILSLRPFNDIANPQEAERFWKCGGCSQIFSRTSGDRKLFKKLDLRFKCVKIELGEMTENKKSQKLDKFIRKV